MKESTDLIRVLIVDDHPAIRDALTRIIQHKIGMVVCGEAASAAEAFPLIERENPDVVVIDLSLGDAHGMDLVRSVRERFPAVRLVIYSMFDERVYADLAIRAGASAYLMKTQPLHHVLEAIQNAYDAHVHLSQAMTKRLLNIPSSNSNRLGLTVDSFTDREQLVFEMIGKRYTVREIAEKLGIETKTVETYRRHAKEKLGLHSVNELLQFAIRWMQERGESGA